MIIYKVTNDITGSTYIGQTTYSLPKRKTAHKYKAFKDNKQSLFHVAIREYGWDNFTWDVLYECEGDETLDEMEREYIAREENSYNMQSGGLGGFKSPEGMTRKSYIRTPISYLKYTVTSPNDEVYAVGNLLEFCNEHGLDYAMMASRATGHGVVVDGWDVDHDDGIRRAKAQVERENVIIRANINLRDVEGHQLIKDDEVYTFDSIRRFCIEQPSLDLGSQFTISKILKGTYVKGSYRGFSKP